MSPSNANNEVLATTHIRIVYGNGSRNPELVECIFTPSHFERQGWDKCRNLLARIANAETKERFEKLRLAFGKSKQPFPPIDAEMSLYRRLFQYNLFVDFSITIWFTRDLAHYHFSLPPSVGISVPDFIMEYPNEERAIQFALLVPKHYRAFRRGKVDLPRSVCVQHELKLKRYQETEKHLHLTYDHKMKIDPYLSGYVFRTLPVEILTNPGTQPKIKSEWVLTEGVERNLRDLQHLWQNPSSQFVLVCGSPGSGKETFSQAIHCGKRRREGTITVSFASISKDEADKLLYGGISGRGEVIGGYLKEAENRTLFIDEIDKAGEDVRASLLRTMESRQYLIPGSSQTRRWEDVLWVFAAGSGYEKLRGEKPPDFWTRMTDIVEMSHPITDLHQAGINSLGNRKCYETAIKDVLFYHYAREILDSIRPANSEKNGIEKALIEIYHNIIRANARRKWEDVSPEILFRTSAFHDLVASFRSIRDPKSDLAQVLLSSWCNCISEILCEIAKKDSPYAIGCDVLLYKRLNIRTLRNVARTLAAHVLTVYPSIKKWISQPIDAAGECPLRQTEERDENREQRRFCKRCRRILTAAISLTWRKVEREELTVICSCV